MKIEIIPEVGDQFKVRKPDPKMHLDWGFCYQNHSGGTPMSNSEWDEKYDYEKAPAIIKITKVWYDDETGYRCWAKAINPELVEYMKRNANPKDQRIFVGQFEIEQIL